MEICRDYICGNSRGSAFHRHITVHLTLFLTVISSPYLWNFGGGDEESRSCFCLWARFDDHVTCCRSNYLFSDFASLHSLSKNLADALLKFSMGKFGEKSAIKVIFFFVLILTLSWTSVHVCSIDSMNFVCDFQVEAIPFVRPRNLWRKIIT